MTITLSTTATAITHESVEARRQKMWHDPDFEMAVERLSPTDQTNIGRPLRSDSSDSHVERVSAALHRLYRAIGDIRRERRDDEQANNLALDNERREVLHELGSAINFFADIKAKSILTQRLSQDATNAEREALKWAMRVARRELKKIDAEFSSVPMISAVSSSTAAKRAAQKARKHARTPAPASAPVQKQPKEKNKK